MFVFTLMINMTVWIHLNRDHKSRERLLYAITHEKIILKIYICTNLFLKMSQPNAPRNFVTTLLRQPVKWHSMSSKKSFYLAFGESAPNKYICWSINLHSSAHLL